jgi:endoglycosylceramidase
MNTLKLAAIGTAAMMADARINVEPETRQFVDENGRSVIFHGVNVVYKIDPFIPSQGDFDPENSLNEEDMVNLKSWGMNFVRLGVMWEAVERTAGVYDTEYLAAIDKLITKLGEAGIYTLVDMHQDVFARSICGEGFPDFYAKEAYGKHPVCISVAADFALKSVY